MTSSVTPLRQRMLDDMHLRNLLPLTRAAYIRESRTSASTITARPISIACAIRFFLSVTLGKNDASLHIPLARQPDTLPAILTRDEVQRFLEAVESVKYKVAFATIYAAARAVYAKRPLAGPEQVLAYLARYTHPVAISGSRLIALANGRVTFRWKDYRQNRTGRPLRRLQARIGLPPPTLKGAFSDSPRPPKGAKSS